MQTVCDQEKIKQLLCETITLLCKNALAFESEISVEALIGITLDKKDIVLVSIKETLCSDEKEIKDVGGGVEKIVSIAGQTNKDFHNIHHSLSPVAAIERKRRLSSHHSENTDTDAGVVEHLQFEKDESRVLPPTKNKHKRRKTLPKKIECSNQLNDAYDSPSLDDTGRDLFSSRSEVSMELPSSKMLHKTRISDGTHPRISDAVAVKFEKIETDDLIENCNNTGMVNPVEASFKDACYPSNSRNNLLQSFRESFNHQFSFPLEFPENFQSSIIRKSELNEMSADGHPPLSNSMDAIFMASLILAIPGAFVNLGCIKAVCQKLRQFSKETIVAVLEVISVPPTSPYFVGVLHCEGPTRTFYKCPPNIIKQEALQYYNIDYPTYVGMYCRPIKIPNNIRDPVEWIQRTKMMSPFPDQHSLQTIF